MKMKALIALYLAMLFINPAIGEEATVDDLIDEAEDLIEDSPEDAIKLLEEIISRDSDDQLNKKAYYLKGVAYAELGDYDDAIESYDEALCIDDKYVDALYGKAAAHSSLENCEEAKDCYDKIESEKLDAISSLMNEKGMNLKNCGIKITEGPVGADPVTENERMVAIYEDAIERYNKSIEADENYTFAWNNKGVALGELGRYDAAVECFNRAIEINDSSAEAWSNKGVTLDYMGEHREALDCYNRSIDIDSLLAEAWYNKGNNLAHYTGRYKDAKACYNESIEIKPELENVLKRFIYLETSGRG